MIQLPSAACTHFLRKSGKKVSQETFLTAICHLNITESLDFDVHSQVIWIMNMLEEMKTSSSMLSVQQASVGAAKEICSSPESWSEPSVLPLNCSCHEPD